MPLTVALIAADHPRRRRARARETPPARAAARGVRAGRDWCSATFDRGSKRTPCTPEANSVSLLPPNKSEVSCTRIVGGARRCCNWTFRLADRDLRLGRHVNSLQTHARLARGGVCGSGRDG